MACRSYFFFAAFLAGAFFAGAFFGAAFFTAAFGIWRLLLTPGMLVDGSRLFDVAVLPGPGGPFQPG
jgi:hypothetical protein